MDEALSEIAKHLPFRSKIAIKLCNSRCMQFVRIYEVPKKLHKKWNEERIDLFPDIREIYYSLGFNFIEDCDKMSFDYRKLSKLKLISLSINDILFCGICRCPYSAVIFNSIKHMSKTLKKFTYSLSHMHGAQRSKCFNINDILPTLDLEYLDCDWTDDVEFDAIKHMNNIKTMNRFYPINAYIGSSKIKRNIKYYSINCPSNTSINFDGFERMNVEILCIEYDKFDRNDNLHAMYINTLKKMHVHHLKLNIISQDIYVEDIMRFISIFNINKLTLNTDYVIKQKIPVDFFIKRKIQYLDLPSYMYANYSIHEQNYLLRNCFIAFY